MGEKHLLSHFLLIFTSGVGQFWKPIVGQFSMPIDILHNHFSFPWSNGSLYHLISVSILSREKAMILLMAMAFAYGNKYKKGSKL